MESNAMHALNRKIEDLVDEATLITVLERLVLICHEKADHLRSNWQDSESAKAWVRASKLLDAAMQKMDDI